MRRPILATTALLLPALLGVAREVSQDEVLRAPAGAFPGRETAVRALEVSADLEAEHYLLLGPASAGEGVEAGAAPLLGVARRAARTEGEATWVELEAHLFDPATRVHHAERYSAREGPRLVYREVRDRAGRTVLLEWDDDLGALRSTEWTGAREATRRTVDPEGGALLWLWCMEQVRAGAELRGLLPIFDPLAGRTELLSVESERFGPFGAPLRATTWRRADGTIAASFVAAGDRILLWRRQRGGPVYLRVDATEYGVALAWGREHGGVPGVVTGSLRGDIEKGR